MIDYFKPQSGLDLFGTVKCVLFGHRWRVTGFTWHALDDIWRIRRHAVPHTRGKCDSCGLTYSGIPRGFKPASWGPAGVFYDQKQ